MPILSWSSGRPRPPRSASSETAACISSAARTARSGSSSCAWGTPKRARSTKRRLVGLPKLSFSLLVPARHEEAVLEETLEQMQRLYYPSFEVIVIVGHDDPETTAVARAWGRAWPRLYDSFGGNPWAARRSQRRHRSGTLSGS
jgi:cellulose synthase/poly-beta-1,6-N-acetylglucosamine synthase-like glycosyltransferase